MIPPNDRYLSLPGHSEKAADGKSYVNKQTGEKSEAYSKFVAPIQNGSRGGFDVHIYYFQVHQAILFFR